MRRRSRPGQLNRLHILATFSRFGESKTDIMQIGGKSDSNFLVAGI